MATVTNVGKWNRIYSLFDGQPRAYGDTVTYELGARFLADCATVEDWGCGGGWFKKFVGAQQRYVGVDGSRTPFADVIADLAAYASRAEGIFMRHVLEHDRRWQAILDNALASAQRKLCIVLFTPLAIERTYVLNERSADIDVPDISFWLPELTQRIEHVGARVEAFKKLRTNTQYGEETILFVTKIVTKIVTKKGAR